MWDSFNDMWGDQFNDEKYWPPSEDTLATEEDLIDANTVTFAEIDNSNRINDSVNSLEEAINEGAEPERFKELKSNFVFVGNMLLRDWEKGHIDETIVIEMGLKINRCKRMCEKKIIESVNF
jgi:hypothetical protein